MKKLFELLTGKKPKVNTGKNEKECNEACENVEEPEEIKKESEGNTWEEYIFL